MEFRKIHHTLITNSSALFCCPCHTASSCHDLFSVTESGPFRVLDRGLSWADIGVSATLQVAFGWSDEHLYSFQIRGWQFGDPARAIELALAGGVDLPLAAFIFEINETFRYQYNLFVPWEIDCRIESRSLVPIAQPLRMPRRAGDPPDEELNGPAAYPDWLEGSSPSWALHQIEELLDDDLGDERFRAEARDILANTRLG